VGTACFGDCGIFSDRLLVYHVFVYRPLRGCCFGGGGFHGCDFCGDSIFVYRVFSGRSCCNYGRKLVNHRHKQGFTAVENFIGTNGARVRRFE
jgi:hypothetical protein